MLNPAAIGPGQEQHEMFTSSFTKRRMCQYDYRNHDGELFSCIKRTLDDCRADRDAWISAKTA
jgi:hypothetical protein